MYIKQTRLQRKHIGSYNLTVPEEGGLPAISMLAVYPATTTSVDSGHLQCVEET